MAKVVLFGTAGIAMVMRYYLERDSPHQVAGYCVDASRITTATFMGLPVVAFEDVARAFPPDSHQMYVAIGVTRVNHLRAERYEQAKGMGYVMLSYVSSRALVWPDLVIGDNAAVMEGSIIQPFVTIGNDVIVGPGSSIGHHTSVGDHCFLGSRANLSGEVVVEPHCVLGAGCTIRDCVTIARECVIGAGVGIHADTRANGVYVTKRAELMMLPSDKLPRI